MASFLHVLGYITAVIASSIISCHGDEQPASQLLLFQHLPDDHLQPAPHQLVIRSNFKGSVEFVESDNFRIEVNVTAADTDALAEVQYNYSSYQGDIQLQLFKGSPAEEGGFALGFILMAVGGATGLAFFFSIIFVCWWNAVKRPNLPDTKFISPDSSQAPLLLEGRLQSAGGATGQGGKMRKKKKHGSGHLTSEEYLSSEDDQLDGQPKGSPRIGKPQPSPKKYREGPPEGMTMTPDPTGSPKPVVQYINMQGKPGAHQGNPNYTPLSDQTTLKVRGEPGRGNDMPDVVKRGDAGAGYRGNGRYVPLSSTGPEQDKREMGDYNGMGKLSGAHIAHILRDPSKGSPKHSHNTDKPPVTFSMPADQDQESVSSSRSGESGIKTQGSYESDRTRTPITDSDSARSSTSTSTGARSKDLARHDPRYYLHGARPRDGASPPSSTDLSSEGSSPRLVDEAYGTMGSSSNSTIRSSGTASTGSGSSGSVVTVIAAAEDPNSLYARRRMYPKPPPPPEGASNNAPQGGSLSRNPRGQPRPGGGGGGGRPGAHYMNTSIVCCLALLCISSGVYARRSMETVAHVRVYAPPGFLRQEPKVFTKEGQKVEVTSHDEMFPRKYEVKDAVILDPAEDRCSNQPCAHACDSSTGKCICYEGYMRRGSKCMDVNECRKTYPCGPNSTCRNTDGGFECKCAKDFYGDGHECRACHLPCKNGTWEKMPCDDTHTKVCVECKTACMENYYISAPCTERRDLVCALCRDKCKPDQYEYMPCHGHQNRLCKDITELQKPHTSSNLIYEDLHQVNDVISLEYHQTEEFKPLTMIVPPLTRGGDFSVHVNLKETNLAPLFQAVDHSNSNDNAGFGQKDRTILRDYCPFPVPVNYELSVLLHEHVTTKADYYRCNRKSLDSPERCEMETGYYLNPREACETYARFGRLPNLHDRGWSVLCTRPGQLTDIFKVTGDFVDLTTMFVDREKDCGKRRSDCDNCTQSCARKMQEYQGSHRCNITAEDADNGESPRLQYCYSCCSKEDCSKMCNVYHDTECPQLRCITGSLAEFVLTPKFSKVDTMFGCHIEPVPNYVIYDIEFTVLKNGKRILKDKSLKAQKRFDGRHPSKETMMHDFLKVTYGSAINKVPDLVEGDTSLPGSSFNVGYYQAKGRTVLETDVRQRKLSVRPTTPFAVSSKTWPLQDCNTPKLADLVIPTSAPANEGAPFKQEQHLKVDYVSPGKYRIFNSTQDRLPYIRFEIPHTESLLKAMYEDTTIQDDETLKATLNRQPERWVLTIEGRLSVCPGYFYIKVYDPAFVSDSLYEYDVGAKCPNTFKLDFFIPTSGPDNVDKTLNVELKDSFRTVKLKVFRAAPSQEEKPNAVASSDSDVSPDGIDLTTTVKYEDAGEAKMTVFTPFIAVLCVITSFLALLLVVGFVTEPGRKMPRSDNKVHSQHLLFVVCFVTFRTGYSIMVTFTVLLLLIHYLNRDSLSTLSEFSRYSDSAVNSQQMEIDKIQQFAMAELNRQNALANSTKLQCEDKLHQLQDLLEESKQKMKVQSTDERLVSQVALQYTKLLVTNLTTNVEKFKEEFSDYARSALDHLTRSIVQTSNALDTNKWLAGAKVIHQVVQGKRGTRNTKPFMEWVGLQQQVERLNADLSLNGFPMPNVEEIINITRPHTNYSQQTSIPKISDISLPQNQWYYHYESKPTVDGATQPQRAAKVKVKGSDIISWTTLIGILVVVDLIWFVHRMARTYSTAKMILYGCPAYIDCKRDGRKKFPASSGCFSFLKDLNLRVMKTEFVPKVVATVTMCCCIYLVLGISDKMLTVKTLASVGYFQSMVAPVETSHRLARTRIKTNAYRINKFEYPFYEELVNVRTKRYQLMLDMYADLQQSNSLLHDSEYCAWKKLLEPGEPCNCTTAQSTQISFEGCDLPPVTPKPYLRKDFGTYREHLTSSIVPYINGARQVVMDTCHMVVVFVGLLVLVDTLGAVTWIYLKRFNMLRLKPMFEIEQFPMPQANHVHS